MDHGLRASCEEVIPGSGIRTGPADRLFDVALGLRNACGGEALQRSGC